MIREGVAEWGGESSLQTFFCPQESAGWMWLLTLNSLPLSEKNGAYHWITASVSGIFGLWPSPWLRLKLLSLTQQLAPKPPRAWIWSHIDWSGHLRCSKLTSGWRNQNIRRIAGRIFQYSMDSSTFKMPPGSYINPHLTQMVPNWDLRQKQKSSFRHPMT